MKARETYSLGFIACKAVFCVKGDIYGALFLFVLTKGTNQKIVVFFLMTHISQNMFSLLLEFAMLFYFDYNSALLVRFMLCFTEQVIFLCLLLSCQNTQI